MYFNRKTNIKVAAVDFFFYLQYYIRVRVRISLSYHLNILKTGRKEEDIFLVVWQTATYLGRLTLYHQIKARDKYPTAHSGITSAKSEI